MMMPHGIATVNGIFVFHERITDINHVHFVPQHSTVRHAYNETKKQSITTYFRVNKSDIKSLLTLHAVVFRRFCFHFPCSKIKKLVGQNELTLNN